MDLSTSYLGLKLKNPVVASSSPLTSTLDGMKCLEDAGAAAVVLNSLFEEQLVGEAAELNHFLNQGTESYVEAQTYFPRTGEHILGPEEYLELIRKAKGALRIPVIGSLNGASSGGWTKFAKNIEEAGADAIELNVYFVATEATLSSMEVEQRYLSVLRAVKETVRIPVAMKLSPFFSAMASMAHRLDAEGANGLVLFNRFYQPDIDLESLEVMPNVILSSSEALRLPLRWIAILHGRIKASLAGTSGVHTANDVLKMLLAGANATMMCSALLRHGPARITEVLAGLDRWLTEREYVSVSQMQGGMSQKSVANPAAFERANYMKALQTFR
jgi:dihydroorotate dehydrogenase (fumarate)